ncbi:MAG: hypothetical protein MAG431_02410 [Chloroflexi bacterium]|nr:hypothetical protein [Chloroflexota bacterium]
MQSKSNAGEQLERRMSTDRRAEAPSAFLFFCPSRGQECDKLIPHLKTSYSTKRTGNLRIFSVNYYLKLSKTIDSFR